MRNKHNDSGPSQRQYKVGEVLRRALSEILMRGEVHNPDLDGASITVSEVKCSPDLRQATAYVMPLGGVNAENLLDALNKSRGEIRHLVNRAVSLKYSPQFTFVLDESFDKLDATRAMFSRPDVARDLGD